jgi:hypothetical protein
MRFDQRTFVVAPIAGILLGSLDFLWIKYVPSPVSGLGNSIAIWAVAAFLLSFGFRWPAGRSIAGAVTMLAVAVPSYYVAAALIQDDEWSNAWGIVAWLWIGLAVVAGVVFGLGGALARQPGRVRMPALGLPAAALFAELLMMLTRIGRPNYHTVNLVQYALVLAALAVAVTVAIGRTWRDRAAALVCAIPLAGIGHLLMKAAGIGG